ncbi:MAG: hypothetical protein JO273_23815 [Methylobacteriaceae bacterium]|nr:hypothetical protein [Methylobacteriaceae bacterium]
MKRIALSLAALGAMFAFGLPGAQHAFGQTWVSGTGNNANPCTRALPCLTFAGAFAVTPAGGEIKCVDPGPYFGLTITRAVTIDCEGVEGGVLGQILVNAGASDVVNLRGLDINAFGNDVFSNGIEFVGGAALHVQNCVVRNYIGNSPHGWGIRFAPTTAAELFVSDTVLSNNGSTTIADGGAILINAPPGSTSKVTLNRVEAQGNFFGIKADGSAAAGGVINMTIRDSVSSGNAANGIVGLTASSGGAAVVMMVDRSASSHNGGFGIIAAGPLTFIRVGNSSIAGNATGVGTLSGGTLLSFKTNQIRGNSADGTPLLAVGLD